MSELRQILGVLPRPRSGGRSACSIVDIESLVDSANDLT